VSGENQEGEVLCRGIFVILDVVFHLGFSEKLQVNKLVED